MVRPHRRLAIETPHTCMARFKTNELSVGSLQHSGQFAKYRLQS